MKLPRLALAMVLCAAGAAFAQTVVDTEVKSGLVIGKTDHSVIVKMDDGVVREIQVPPGKTALVDGKEVGLADLKVGTTLAATFHTIAKPVVVKTTTIKDGEVFKVNGSTLITKEKDGLHTYNVPKGFRFNVDGKEVGVEDLTAGMKINATIVRTSTKMTTETERGKVSGAAPVAPAPAPVAAAPAPAPAPVAAAAPAPAPVADAAPARKKKLPKTASPMPLIGLLGGLSVAVGAGLRKLRSR
jgi:phage gp45-like